MATSVATLRSLPPGTTIALESHGNLGQTAWVLRLDDPTELVFTVVLAAPDLQSDVPLVAAGDQVKLELVSYCGDRSTDIRYNSVIQLAGAPEPIRLPVLQLRAGRNVLIEREN